MPLPGAQSIDSPVEAWSRCSEGVRENRPTLGELAGLVNTKGGRGVLVGLVLVAVVVAGCIVYPLVFASVLKARGEKITQAWLSKNAEQIQSLVQPEQSGKVTTWLAKHPPPNSESLKGAPTVNVAVERDDGKTADLVVQVTAKKKDGQPAFYVFHHHWIQKGGDWYFQPPQ